MYRFSAPILLVCATILATPPASATIVIDSISVGNVGNANDPGNGGLYGGVNYAYNIGTYEVTNAQYVEFLNTKAASDPLTLYNTNMGSNVRGGITRSGVSGSFTYAAKTDMGNKPVNYVSWYDAVRFANWLHNGQGAGNTETGAYTLLGGASTPTNGLSITRNGGATWFLASENEWYKAAYHQPAAQGGDADSYWLYPTASNSPPTAATANSVGDISNPGANVVNYLNGADWNSQDGNVTNIGSAGPLSESFYGTSDQGGNVWEWNEALKSGSFRGLIGGSWQQGNPFPLQSGGGIILNPTDEWNDVGFRVASIPEPSSLLCCGLVMFGVLFWKWLAS